MPAGVLRREFADPVQAGAAAGSATGALARSVLGSVLRSVLGGSDRFCRAMLDDFARAAREQMLGSDLPGQRLLRRVTSG